MRRSVHAGRRRPRTRPVQRAVAPACASTMRWEVQQGRAGEREGRKQQNVEGTQRSGASTCARLTLSAARAQEVIYPSFAQREEQSREHRAFVASVTDARYLFSTWHLAAAVRNEKRPRTREERCGSSFRVKRHFGDVIREACRAAAPQQIF